MPIKGRVQMTRVFVWSEAGASDKNQKRNHGEGLLLPVHKCNRLICQARCLRRRAAVGLRAADLSGGAFKIRRKASSNFIPLRFRRGLLVCLGFGAGSLFTVLL